MKRLLSLVILACLASGCASGPKQPKDGHVPYQVSIETSEPGARIEIDNEDVGKSPVTVTVMGDRDGTFHSFGRPDWVVKAYPLRSGQQVQVKTFHTGAWFWVPEDRIPSKIYFDMGVVTEKTDLNLNPNTSPAKK
jgi:hypothetical protein